MTADIDCARQTGNVCRIGVDGAHQCRDRAAQTLRSNAQRIDTFYNLLFHFGITRIFIELTDRTHQRTLCQIACLVGRATQTYADDNRRTRIGASLVTCFHNKVDDILRFCAGVNILSALMFSLPNPFGSTVT